MSDDEDSGDCQPGPIHALATREVSSDGQPVRRVGGVLGRGTPVGRYLIVSLLGRGGMGSVYAAYDPELDRRVALKLLHTAGGTDQARRRLLREARALGKLSHPNVVQVHDVGEHDGDVFVAMELVEGEPLDVWCHGSPRPAWAAVVAAYADAARGLAAAHAKGIVHRDVKPANILRGKDGRVRVADFGIAAGQGETASDPSLRPESSPGFHEVPSVMAETLEAPSVSALVPGVPSMLARTLEAASGARPKVGAAATPDVASPSDERLTATGALLGTPLYMAPEQFEGRGVVPASDQHSLCTALHEGVYGTLPFPVRNGPGMLIEIISQKRLGPPASPPSGPTGPGAPPGDAPDPVPAWVYRVIARGLAPRPEDRFPSMDALADALRGEPTARTPSRLRLPIAAVLAAVAVVAVAVGARRGAFESPCAHPERQLAGVWDTAVRGRVQSAFQGTGRAYARDTAGRVERFLDAYAASWTTMRGEVCEASRAGTQRREIVGLRDECLDRRLSQMRALTGLLGERSDVQVLDKAAQAAAGLPPVAACAETEALTARVRPPEDPALRARVAALEPQVDRLEALYKAGKYNEGLALVAGVTAEAGEVSHAPLRARFQCATGMLREGTGDYEGARELLRDAAAAAVEGRDDVLAATAWTRLLFVVGERQQRLEEAALLRALAPVVVHTRDEPTLAAFANVEGLTLFRAGKFAEARDHYLRALAMFERAVGPDHPSVASVLNNLANALRALGDLAQARATFERGLAIWERALGPEHPDVAALVNNLGDTVQHLGDLATARAHFQRAIAIWEKSLGPDHAMVAYAQNNLGAVLYDLGDDAAAVIQFERALPILEAKLGPEHVSVAAPLVGLGRARTRLGQLDAALPLLERARAIREKAQGASHPEVAEPLLGLGELSLARGKPEEAVLVLERALGLHDTDVELDIQLALADALFRVGKDRARARALATRAQGGYERLGHAPGRERASRWLAAHER